MGLKPLIAIFLLSNLAFAGTPSPKKAIDLLHKAQKEMKTLSGPAPSCAVDPLSSPDAICEDLFTASCTGTDGKPKFEGRDKSLQQELTDSINKARDDTAKSMGFKDFDDAAKRKLKDAGLEVSEPVDPDAWKNLKGGGPSGRPSKSLYSTVEECHHEARELQTASSTATDLKQLQELSKKYDSFRSKYLELRIGYHAKDIPNFVSGILPQCEAVKGVPSTNVDPKMRKTCENITQIRKQAINLFRLEGTPEYEEQAKKFVREYLPANSYSASKGDPNKTEIEILREKIDSDGNRSIGNCYMYASLVENAGGKVFRDFVDDVNKSKPTVDAVIDTFYNDQNKQVATQTFQNARTDIKAIVSQLVHDSTKRKKILDGYDDLKLFWIDKPAESSYTKNRNGIPILDEEKSASEIPRALSGTDDLFTIFSDPSLSYFTTLNANYRPSRSVGDFKNSERVNILPAMIHLTEKNPYTFLNVIAHETGHKIGPEISKLNGYDLTPEYKDLIACYKNHKSINLQKGQEDETIADYISSEVLALQIAKLPTEKRREALMSSMETFCIYEDSERNSLNCKYPHPENTLRVGGIFGANPNLREAVGCAGESSQFKSCGLKTGGVK